MSVYKKLLITAAAVSLTAAMSIGAGAEDGDIKNGADTADLQMPAVSQESGVTDIIEEEAADSPDTDGTEEDTYKLYTVDSNVALTVLKDGQAVELHKKKYFADINSDGKFTTTDARILLRMSLHLEAMPDKVEKGDLNEDGKITSSDARLALRAVLKVDSSYCDIEGNSIEGFAKTQDSKNTLYFSKNGELTKGIATVDSKKYYFDENGYMKTGTQTVNGKKYFFNSDGSSASGFTTVNGRKMYFTEDGEYFSGKVKSGNDVFLYRDSLPATEWHYEGLESYYYKDGKMLKNTKMGDFSFDGSGKASVSVLNGTTFDVYLRQILKKNGSSPQDIYNYVHNNFRYKYYEKGEPKEMAMRIIKNGRGACYDYAYLTHYLLEISGYENRVIVGGSFNPNNGSEHDWILYKAGGVWRYMDTQRGRFNMTAGQMRNDGYRWNESGLPQTL